MINWYPGHMTKAMRMIEENLKIVDVIVYVLDSRAPYSCINPDFEQLIKGMPVIYALNKADLGNTARVDEWVRYLSKDNKTALKLSATASKSTASVLSAIMRLCGGKIEKYRSKGVCTTVKCMVLGVPNTGKSTVINNLCGGAKTVTGNKAGVTRGKQWVKVNDYLEVLDTPGVLYPKLSDQSIAKKLAYIGSIKDEVTDTCELALGLINDLNAISPEIIKNRYGKYVSCGENALNELAVMRGCLIKGGEPDTERAAGMLIDDFRKGRLGGITLESVKECIKI